MAVFIICLFRVVTRKPLPLSLIETMYLYPREDGGGPTKSVLTSFRQAELFAKLVSVGRLRLEVLNV